MRLYWCPFARAVQFADIASNISFDRLNEFFALLDDVMDNKVAKVVITYKDRLSRLGFDSFHHLFKRFRHGDRRDLESREPETRFRGSL
jgi:predicted site-specific integrase-resolvase